MSEIEVDVQLVGVNGTDHVQVDPPALAVNLQPMWDDSGENSLKAILHRSLVHLFGLYNELQEFERHVTATLVEVEVLREDMRKSKEEMQQILENRSKLLNAMNDDLTLELHIVMILVISMTFYMCNM
ncbi:hypothetical protein HYPSUDRAFT_202487 [Hypholoma sublateritium FD-334 SS-4]|uniref:Uncharacterized protein n=1 Tax=Hypholoma sublateritium (strain FD-334 SS-4) TaxID=945553 RepID=A0A0D2MEH3_HYPSF|nr:hypothetical protein HYPSUDRAFT_202487 [Hypholoma sublateritium FD-334 SS-4]